MPTNFFLAIMSKTNRMSFMWPQTVPLFSFCDIAYFYNLFRDEHRPWWKLNRNYSGLCHYPGGTARTDCTPLGVLRPTCSFVLMGDDDKDFLWKLKTNVIIMMVTFMLNTCTMYVVQYSFFLKKGKMKNAVHSWSSQKDIHKYIV